MLGGDRQVPRRSPRHTADYSGQWSIQFHGSHRSTVMVHTGPQSLSHCRLLRSMVYSISWFTPVHSPFHFVHEPLFLMVLSGQPSTLVHYSPLQSTSVHHGLVHSSLWSIPVHYSPRFTPLPFTVQSTVVSSPRCTSVHATVQSFNNLFRFVVHFCIGLFSTPAPGLL